VVGMAKYERVVAATGEGGGEDGGGEEGAGMERRGRGGGSLDLSVCGSYSSTRSRYACSLNPGAHP
jgi:hypothetical protein